MKYTLLILTILFSFSAHALPRVSFLVDKDLASEEQGSVTVVAELNRPSQSVVLVPFEISGRARTGQDHNLEDGTLIFTAGQKTVRFSFRVFQDDREEKEEALHIQMLAPVNAVLGHIPQTTVLITDRSFQTPEVEFRQKQQIAGEGDQIIIRARLSKTSERVVVVPYTVTGTTDENDHNLLDGEFVFTPGDRVSDRIVEIHEDGKSEPEESFSVRMIPPVNNASLGKQVVHQVTIEEN